MKFNDYKYERCNYEAIKEVILKDNEAMKSAFDYQSFKNIFDRIMAQFASVETMFSIASVRHTINTEDTFYEKENDFWDEVTPLLQDLKTTVNKTVLESEYLELLKQDVPATYFLLAENAIKSFSPVIIEDMQEENRLASAYQKLIASAQIEFDGSTYTLAGLGAKLQDKDREVRERAFKASWGWFEEHEKEIDTIFDQLVHVRDAMAKKLGYKNYIELGYIIMNRFDYNEDDVKNYRKQVLEDIVPSAQRLYDRQKQRLGYDTFHCYDESYEFVSGNPSPKYDKDEMVKRAQKMYHELSKETGEFFDFMVEHDLLDLEAKKGKAGGGYCTCFPDYKSPFIFSNFNGTSGDVDVLTHEAGHAFQVYSSMDIKPIDCIWPTYESCEIHSMSMEFFAWPWMKSFFEEDCDKYYYLHLGGAIKFIPYGILVDHFQHVIYENVDMSVEERKQAWRDLEKQYLPHKNYESIPFLEKGTWWFKQSHIFASPFYYIDYTLAQVCALQFWQRLYEKDATAFEDYYKICKVGGTLTFTQIVELANLKVPFKDGCLKDVMKGINEYLEAIDDQKL